MGFSLKRMELACPICGKVQGSGADQSSIFIDGNRTFSLKSFQVQDKTYMICYIRGRVVFKGTSMLAYSLDKIQKKSSGFNLPEYKKP